MWFTLKYPAIRSLHQRTYGPWSKRTKSSWPNFCIINRHSSRRGSFYTVCCAPSCTTQYRSSPQTEWKKDHQQPRKIKTIILKLLRIEKTLFMQYFWWKVSGNVCLFYHKNSNQGKIKSLIEEVLCSELFKKAIKEIWGQSLLVY